MIKEFVKRWDEGKHIVREGFSRAHPETYQDIVRAVVEILNDGYGTPDPTRIHEIDDGDNQGTLVFVIAAEGYQPHKYWYVRVWYGSCSGCDTLQGIRRYLSDPPNHDEVEQYMTLALHIVQRLKQMDDPEDAI